MQQDRQVCIVVSSVITVKSFLSDILFGLEDSFKVFLVGNFNEQDSTYLSTLNISGYYSIEICRNINILKDFSSFIKLTRYLKNGNFFITHSITPKAGFITALASKIVGIPHRIHTFTGQVWFTRKGLMKILLMQIDRIIAGLNNHILVDGKPQRQFLISKNIVNAKKSSVLGKGSLCGVNLQRFKLDSRMRTRLRDELRLQEKVVFGFVGRLNVDKGIRELFTAFNRLAKSNMNVFLLFVGWDENNMISFLPLYNYIIPDVNFKFLGYTDKPENILQVVDVFCLPSHREGFATSVLEASALSMPVICSDTYGLRDNMIDNVTGLRHKVGDSNCLYNQMRILVDNDELRSHLGNNGRQYVTENFSSTKIIGEWRKYYNSLQ